MDILDKERREDVNRSYSPGPKSEQARLTRGKERPAWARDWSSVEDPFKNGTMAVGKSAMEILESFARGDGRGVVVAANDYKDGFVEVMSSEEVRGSLRSPALAKKLTNYTRGLMNDPDYLALVATVTGNQSMVNLRGQVSEEQMIKERQADPFWQAFQMEDLAVKKLELEARIAEADSKIEVASSDIEKKQLEKELQRLKNVGASVNNEYNTYLGELRLKQQEFLNKRAELDFMSSEIDLEKASEELKQEYEQTQQAAYNSESAYFRMLQAMLAGQVTKMNALAQANEGMGDLMGVGKSVIEMLKTQIDSGKDSYKPQAQNMLSQVVTSLFETFSRNMDAYGTNTISYQGADGEMITEEIKNLDIVSIDALSAENRNNIFDMVANLLGAEPGEVERYRVGNEETGVTRESNDLADRYGIK